MAKTFGVPLNEDVKFQLKVRRSNLIDDNKRDDVLRTTSLHNQGSWIRCVSGVNGLPASEEEYLASVLNAQRSQQYIDALNEYFSDDKKNNVLAKMNILSGGTTYNKVAQNDKGASVMKEYRKDGIDLHKFNEKPTRSSYEYSDVGGIVPMMGIVDFTIKSKSQYGTLREAELKIKAWSPEQLDILERLYFKPGFTMLVEWGNSVYLDKYGLLTTELNTVTKSFLAGKKTIKQLQGKASQLTSDSGNNYDAMFGKVINFSWEYATDGSYDCTLKIMGKGEVLESISSTFYTGFENNSHRSFYDKWWAAAKKDDKDLLLEIFKALTNTARVDEYIKKKFPKSKIKVYKSGLQNTSSEEEDVESTAYEYFITIRDLLYILNEAVLSEDFSGAGETRFNIDFNRQEYITFPGHVSGDPYICGIPYVNKDFTLGPDKKYPSTKSFLGKGYNSGAKIPNELVKASKMTSDNEDANLKSPLSLLINVNYLIGLQREALKKLKEQDKETSIFQLVAKVLKDTSTALGGINSLDLNLDKARNEWYVIDRNLYNPIKENEKLPSIDIMGLGSLVTNFGISSKISSKMATMLSISAAAGSNKSKGQDNFIQFNNGATDRYATPPKSREKKTKEFPSNSMSNAKTRKEAKVEIAKAYYNYATKKSDDDQGFSSIARTHKVITQFLLKMWQLKSRQDKKPNPTNVLLPIELSITMRGIAGIKMGEAFTISREILPSRYRDRVGFVITGLSHKIGGDNIWMTDIKTNMFMLPITDPSVNVEDYTEFKKFDEPKEEEPVEDFTGETPNVDKLRAAITAAGFREKGNELGNGGDITADTMKLGTAVINTVKSELPGIGLRFTGGNDKYHHNIKAYKSRHTKGRALDFTIYPYSVSNYKATLKVLQGFAAGGNNQVRYLDEYKNMTVKASGVHFHLSWGYGSEGAKNVKDSVKLANLKKIKKYYV